MSTAWPMDEDRMEVRQEPAPNQASLTTFPPTSHSLWPETPGGLLDDPLNNVLDNLLSADLVNPLNNYLNDPLSNYDQNFTSDTAMMLEQEDLPPPHDTLQGTSIPFLF